jgi:hypothetical protein
MCLCNCGGAFAGEIPFEACHWLQLENEDGLPCRAGSRDLPSSNTFACALASNNVDMPANIDQASVVNDIAIWRDVIVRMTGRPA